MPEPIKLRIESEYDGKGAKEALQDKEKLAQPLPDRDAKTGRFIAGDKEAEAAQLRAETAAKHPAPRIIDTTTVGTRSEGAGAYEADRTRVGGMRDAQGLKASAAAAMQEPAAAEAQKSASVEGREAAREATRAEQTLARERRAVAKAQEIEERAQAARRLTLARAGGSALERVTGGSSLGGLGGAFGGTSVLGVVAGAVAAAVVGVAAAFARQRSEAAIIGLQDTAARTVDARRQMRAAGFEGSSGGSREAAEGYRDEITERMAKRDEIAEKARFKWYSPSNWMDRMSGAAGNENKANEDAIVRAAENEQKARANQRKKFAAETGLELQAEEKRLANDARGARDLEHRVQWTREYNRLMREGATMTEAQGGAGMRVAESIRQEQQMWGSKVNARSGAGDVARLAAMATGEFGSRSSTPVVSAIDRLIAQSRAHHVEGSNSSPHTTFVRPPLRPSV